MKNQQSPKVHLVEIPCIIFSSLTLKINTENDMQFKFLDFILYQCEVKVDEW